MRPTDVSSTVSVNGEIFKVLEGVQGDNEDKVMQGREYCNGEL